MTSEEKPVWPDDTSGVLLPYDDSSEPATRLKSHEKMKLVAYFTPGEFLDFKYLAQKHDFGNFNSIPMYVKVDLIGYFCDRLLDPDNIPVEIEHQETSDGLNGNVVFFRSEPSRSFIFKE